jgi:hypothetical protein
MSRFRCLLWLTGAILVAASCDSNKVMEPVAGAAARDLAPPADQAGLVLTMTGNGGAATELGSPVSLSNDIALQATIRWAGPTSSETQVILYNGNTAMNGWGITLLNGKIAVLAGGVFYQATALAPTLNTWQHLTAVRTGNTVHVDLDGATADLTPGINPPSAVNSRTMVGAAFDASGVASLGFNGAIDNARISTNAGALIETWNFDDALGTTATGTNGTVLTLVNALALSPNPLSISIDPRHEDKIVEPERGKFIQVAVLSTPGIDATTIDPSTVMFGPGLAKPKGSERVDVDHDRVKDVVYRFDLGEAGLTCIDRSAALRATVNGRPSIGTDSLHTIVTELPAHTYIARCANPRIIARELMPDGTQFSPDLINDRGDVVGTSSAGGVEKAIRLRGGEVESFALPAIFPYSLNERGDVGLVAYDGGTPRNFVWSGATPTEFNPPCDFAFLSVVDERGNPVGICYPNGVPTIWRFNRGVAETVALPGLDASISGVTTDGTIGGVIYDETFTQQPFFLDGTTLTKVGNPGDGVIAINARGEMVGTGFDAAGNPIAYLWTRSGTTTLATMRLACGINRRGDVCLYDWNSGEVDLWRNGRITKVNGNAGFSVSAMNDKAEILASDFVHGTPEVFLPDGTGLALMDGQFKGLLGSARAFNNRGEIVGSVLLPSGSRAMAWQILK